MGKALVHEPLNFHKLLWLLMILFIMASFSIIMGLFWRTTEEVHSVAQYKAYENPVNNNEIENILFKGFDMDKDNITLTYEGKTLDLQLPVYVDKNRYYLSVTEILPKMGGKLTNGDTGVMIEYAQHTVNLDTLNNTVIKDGTAFPLKKKMLVEGKVVYLSLFDFCKIFNIKTDWNYETKTINLFRNRQEVIPAQAPQGGKPALVRLEDVTMSPGYSGAESLAKLRAVADYLYGANVPFHVAWVPRYVDPRPGAVIDNDLANQYSMYNADFLFTLDYMIDRKGMVGLHGYTHQYGNSVSVEGKEFHSSAKDGIPPDGQYAQDRINKAVEAAQKLEIPYGFFETPHYAANPAQLSVIERNFDYIYQPYGDKWTGKVERKNNNGRIIKYIPTPLDYLNYKNDLPNMLNRINKLKPDAIGSFFYHPAIEFDYINISKDESGYPTITYAADSPLHTIIGRLTARGYKFVSINQL